MEHDFTNTLLFRLLTALAIGLIVGIERGWRERDAPAGSRTAGVRTYTLAAVLGAVAAEITRAISSPWPLSFSLVAFIALFAAFKLREMESDQEFSVTGILAAFVVFSLGALCVVGDPTSAAAGGVATAVVLAAREPLHGLLTRITWKELRSALLLLAMTVIVLPPLPDRTIDPWSSLNPREVWLFMILTATVSFGGYIAVKLVGPSLGVIVGGLVGSIVSSTAVTIAFAYRSRTAKAPGALAGGAAVGGAVSIIRVFVIVAFVAPQLAADIALPALAAALIFALGSVTTLLKTRSHEAADVNVGNPFDILPLLLFASAYSAIVMLNGWLIQHVDVRVMLLTSSISALFDVDVAVLTATRTAGAAIANELAVRAILLALAMNAFARAMIAAAAGAPAFAAIYLTVTAVAAIAGAAAWLLGS
jgi:uncharacterized membrane protein (DUF4010 family)